MTFEIIKNAEIPKNWGGGAGAPSKYPFARMEVGDGFDAPSDMGKSNKGCCKRQSTISTSARLYIQRHNLTAKFTVRKLDENTVRCVRTA